jgi:hypothetical protein
MMTKSNAFQSARLAGYAVDDGNRAHVYRLTAMPPVQAGIASYRELFASQLGDTRAKVLHDLALMASVAVTECVDDAWQVVPKSQRTPEHRRALVGLEVIRKQATTTLQPKYARLEALREIADIVGIKEHDEGKGEGLSLRITLGQQVNVDGATVAQQGGHLQMHTPQDPPDEKDEA